jgi:stearoyl-CoA desaturase (delta-9 desaturase)
VVPLLVFFVADTLNMLTISVLYHRDLAHGTIRLSPRLRRCWIWLGPWVTGMDPLGWTVMHRMHHAWTDTPKDPHSPSNVGLMGVFLAQLRSYERVLTDLLKDREETWRFGRELGLDVRPMYARKQWWLPWAVNAAGAVLIGLALGPISGAAWFVGIATHPIQGGLINGFGHSRGYRNHDTPDDSTNHIVVAALTYGEGFQNNHHANPSSPEFRSQWWELDLGFVFCLALEAVGLAEIAHDQRTINLQEG